MAKPERPTLHEVVARFDDPGKLKEAVSELQSHGFDRAEISFIAQEDARRHVAGGDADMRDAADDPAAPRAAVVSEPDLRQGRPLVTIAAAC